MELDPAILLVLDPKELRTFLALHQLADRKGVIDASMVVLGELTGYTRESLRLAIRGLEKRSLVATLRKKRNGGKLSRNVYTLYPCQENLASTGDSNISKPGKKIFLYDMNSNNSHVTMPAKKEIAMEKWKPRGEDTSGDDEIGGVGLFDDEKPAAVKHKLSTDKRDPKTRGRRPQEEWTPADIAVEFSYQLAKKYPYLPGLLNTGQLRGALAKNRKQFGITAVIELEILRMFMADESKHRIDQPQLIYKFFLRMFTTHMDKALANLGMPTRRELSGVVDDEPVEMYVYASDGRAFDNSMFGRKQLDKYESKLKGKTNA